MLGAAGIGAAPLVVQPRHQMLDTTSPQALRGCRMPVWLLNERTIATPTSGQDVLQVVLVLVAIVIVMHRRAGPAFALAAVLAAVAAYLLDGRLYLPLAILLAGVLTRPQAHGRRYGWSRVGGEFAVVGLGFVLYELGRAISEGSAETAQANAGRLLDLQRAMHLPSEASLQQLILPYAWLVALFNFIYSYMFLFVVIAVLFWLFLNNPLTYRLYRDALGWSAMATVAISAAVPVAPPRLVARSGLVDTHVLVGAQHGFINQYAALPSLHVGWSVLAGAMLMRATGDARVRLLGLVPGLVIGATVVVTGNHYWIDGVAGAAICLTPLALVRAPGRTPRPPLRLPAGLRSAWHALLETLRLRRAVRLAVLALGGLLGYLLIGQLVAPGFTDHWGYHTAQLCFYLTVALVGEACFRREGGLFGAPTLAVVVAATGADVLGTTDDLYATYVAYDKIVHFFGTAAITAVVLDLLLACAARGRIQRPPDRLVPLGVLLGITAGIAWEVYEFIGDTVFDSARFGGRVDTSYDLLFDTLGALLMGTIAALRIWPLGWRTVLPEERLIKEYPRVEAPAPEPRGD